MKWRTEIGLTLIGVATTLLMATGCGDDDGAGQNNTNHVIFSDSGVIDSTTPQPDAATGDCDRNGFTAVTELATYNTGYENLVYQAANSTDLPYDRVSLSSLSGWGGPTTPGSYTLEGTVNDNYETCGLCPRAFSYSTTGEPDKQFYADTGTVEITQIGTIGGTFAATFHNLIFREVTIDTSTWVSTVVPGGEVWCIDGFSFNESIEDDTTVCAQPGTCIGDDVADFQITSCETGNPVSAYSLMTGMNALWLVGSHEW
jgi:hypothetical protein